MIYAVKVKEVLERTVLVNADSWEEARDSVEEAYNCQDIILDADDMQEGADFLPSETFDKEGISEEDERLEYFQRL